ncbi:hypothetical protein GJ744_002608 [Endocarpon pusillum]|uniref:NAD(P)-binding protein n=1 Tax=Endocarpon pusillum TaxID=364733 RepID=A0A8H7DYP8_9EURO|nr:hypothetical protein GJ744_002608 [Endocarpon pusillum]
MVFQNTYRGFLYRQFFITPALILPSEVSLAGKTGIVTGSNTGLGYHASAQLLSLGLSHLILAVRDTSKGEKARTSLLSALEQSGSKHQPTIEIWPVDLTDYASITDFATRVRNALKLRIDFAILNAGVAHLNFGQAPNGNELTIQTNWLGSALMALLLHPILQAQYTRAKTSLNGSAQGSGLKPPVLSIVGSEVAQWAVFKERKMAASQNTSVLSVLNDKKNFNPGDRYFTSKLLLTLFFVEFFNHLPAPNDVIVNIVNPGFCNGTELDRTLSGWLGKVFVGMKRGIGRSTDVGARTLVHAAVVAGNESQGCYLSDQKVAPWMDFVVSEKGTQARREMWREMRQELAGVVDVDAVMKEA